MFLLFCFLNLIEMLNFLYKVFIYIKYFLYKDPYDDPGPYNIPVQPKEVGAVITPFLSDLSPHGLRWGR